MKIFKVEFEPIYPVGSALIIAALDLVDAEFIASNTIVHTDKFVINEVDITEAKVIVYVDGNY